MKKYQVRTRDIGVVMAEFMAREDDANTIFQQFFANGDCLVFQVNEEVELELTDHFLTALDQAELEEDEANTFEAKLAELVDQSVGVKSVGFWTFGEITSVGPDWLVLKPAREYESIQTIRLDTIEAFSAHGN